MHRTEWGRGETMRKALTLVTWLQKKRVRFTVLDVQQLLGLNRHTARRWLHIAESLGLVERGRRVAVTDLQVWFSTCASKQAHSTEVAKKHGSKAKEEQYAQA
jgi:DNA-binding IclR family transcriptional regulator